MSDTQWELGKVVEVQGRLWVSTRSPLVSFSAPSDGIPSSLAPRVLVFHKRSPSKVVRTLLLYPTCVSKVPSLTSASVGHRGSRGHYCGVKSFVSRESGTERGRREWRSGGATFTRGVGSRLHVRLVPSQGP